MRSALFLGLAAALACAAPALAEPPTRSGAVIIDQDPYVSEPTRSPVVPPAQATPEQVQEETTQATTRRLVQIDDQGRVISNAPIPDTAVNRERYGQPLSRAGRRSPAKGD